LATKNKKPTTKTKATETKVTRIKAADTAESTPDVVKKVKSPKPVVAKAKQTGIRNPFAPIAGYFKGAWYELRQVRWPNRKETWSLTGAMLAFTAFFVVLILLLDALFKYLFQLILG